MSFFNTIRDSSCKTQKPRRQKNSARSSKPHVPTSSPASPIYNDIVCRPKNWVHVFKLNQKS